MSGMHWLSATLQRAGVAGADSLALERGVAARDAWAAARRALHVGDPELARHIASRFHLRLAEPERAAAAAAKLVPESLARKHQVIPMREDDREIIIATADPTDLDAEQALAFASGRQVQFEIAPPEGIASAIERIYAPHAAVESLVERLDTTPADSVRFVHDDVAGTVARADSGQSVPVIRLTNLIVRAALDHRADLLEIGPVDDAGVVSLRIDGEWSRLMPLPVPAMRHVRGRLRMLGNLGLGNRSWTRGGLARITVEGRTYDLLVTTPENAGGNVTRVRFFDQQLQPRLGDLSLDDDAGTALRDVIDGSGLVIIAGPEGSGVTTLQYALLREAAGNGRRVALVDDGLRWELHGVEHVPVTPEDRAAVLRRVASRPIEVLGIDDAADAATAGALAHAVVPGRLVVLRSGAAGAAAARDLLRDRIGEDRFAALPGRLVSVRLLRRLCAACGGEACEHCAATGYRGVLPIVAILPPDASAREESAQLEAAARRRIERNETTPAEMKRLDVVAAATPPAARPTLVLVADDDPLIRLLAQTVLEADGMESLEAEDGIEALRRIEERRDVDVVVLDLDMPRLDGHGVLARLKRDVRTAGLPVIVLTASTHPEDEARVLRQGAADYIRKPIDPPRFQARIRAVLHRNRG